MSKAHDNYLKKRSNLLEAAERLFLAQGYERTTMDAVAAEAKVTKQTVYRYFTSKTDLFTALVTQRRLAKESFLDALQLSDTRQALTTFAAGFIKRHLSREHLANVRLLVAEGPSVPEMTRAFYAFGSEKTQDSLVRFIEDRFDRKDAVDEIQAFVSMLISLRMPVLTGLREPLSEEEITRHADKTVRMFLKLLDATI